MPDISPSPETVRFLAGDPTHNREEADKVIDALNQEYGGYVFACVAIVKDEQEAVLAVQVLPVAKKMDTFPNYPLGEYEVPLEQDIPIRQIVDSYRKELDDLLDSSR